MGASNSRIYRSTEDQHTIKLFGEWLHSLPADLRNNATQSGLTVTYHAMESDVKGLQWTDCNLEKVLLYKCKLDNLKLQNVRLSNVCFIGISWDGGYDMKDYSMANQFVVNDTVDWYQVIDTRLFQKRTSMKPNSDFFPGHALRRSTRLGDDKHSDELSLPDAYRAFASPHMKVWQLGGHGINFLAGLGKHRKILERLADHLMPPGACHIYEFGPNDPRTEFTNRTYYGKPYSTAERALGFTGGEYSTTYFGSMRVLVPGSDQHDWDLRGLDHSTNLMLVSRTVRTIVLPKMYQREFSMHCSFRGVIAFLKDHSEVGLGRITLHFNSVQDNNEHWRELMRFIRHEFSHLKEVHLVVGAFLWNAMHPRSQPLQLVKPLDVRRYVNVESLRRAAELPHHFLRDFGKIPTPVKRKCFEFEEGNPNRREDRGTKTSIEILGADTAKRVAFVKEMNHWLRELGKRRPRFVVIDGKGYRYRNPEGDTALRRWR